MSLEVLLASLSGFYVGRVLDKVMSGDKKFEDIEEGDADEAASAEAVEAGPSEAQVDDTAEETTAEATVVTLKVPPKKKAGAPDLEQAIVDILSGSGEAMTLAKISTKMGKKHFAPLIGPMRSLLESERVIKEDKAYRLA